MSDSAPKTLRRDARRGGPHLLRVEEEARAFGPLLVTAAAAGVRVGWLELQEAPPVPESLRAVLVAGGERAVAIGAGWSLAARGRKGPAVLHDVLRQHFLGCTLVLVHGAVEAPLLRAGLEGHWSIVAVDGATQRYDADELVAALRRPRLGPS